MNFQDWAMDAFKDAARERVVALLSADTVAGSVDQLLRDMATRFTDPEHGVFFITQPPLNTEVQEAIATRIQVGVDRGELPPDTSVKDSASYIGVVIQALALQAHHGGTREDLMRVVDLVKSTWVKTQGWATQRPKATKSAPSHDH